MIRKQFWVENMGCKFKMLQTNLTSACISTVKNPASHPPLCSPHTVSLHFQCWWIKLELENLKIIDENRVTRGYLQHLWCIQAYTRQSVQTPLPRQFQAHTPLDSQLRNSEKTSGNIPTKTEVLIAELVNCADLIEFYMMSNAPYYYELYTMR